MLDISEKRKVTCQRAPLVSRLDLTIGSTTYAIEPLAETLLAGTRAFRLIKNDGTIYDVAQTSYGPQCDCPDYLFRRDGLDPSGCKHIKALVGWGMIEPAT
jgi:hypothetical protein